MSLAAVDVVLVLAHDRHVALEGLPRTADLVVTGDGSIGYAVPDDFFIVGHEDDLVRVCLNPTGRRGVALFELDFGGVALRMRVEESAAALAVRLRRHGWRVSTTELPSQAADTVLVLPEQRRPQAAPVRTGPSATKRLVSALGWGPRRPARARA